jgi:hypothetical protein
VGNAWFVSPLSDEWTDPANPLGVTAPPGSRPGTAPSPEQVLAALESFPQYRVGVRRRDRKEKGQAVYVELRREDGSHAIDIHLLRVAADDRPAGVFVFDYYRGTDELVRLVAKLAEVCGPLVLWHDSGGEPSVLVTPGSQSEPGAGPDPAG